MSVAQQAIAARRKARSDERYPQNRKDAAVRAARLRRKVENEKLRQQRKNAGKK